MNNIRISCCGLNLIITHIIVQTESLARQKVGIRHFPKMGFECCVMKLLFFGTVFLPILAKLSFKWFFLLSKRQNFLRMYII